MLCLLVAGCGDRGDAANQCFGMALSPRALVVVRHGRIVAERYADGVDPEQLHPSYSMAKGVTSALVGIAIDRGLLAGTHERVCSYYDAWDCDDADDPRSRITVDHLMNLTSGLQWHEDWSEGASGVNDVLIGFGDLVGHALSKPAEHEPGEVMRYSTGDPALLTGVLQGATGQTAFAFAQDELFGPLGITDATWSSDAEGRTTTYADLVAVRIANDVPGAEGWDRHARGLLTRLLDAVEPHP
jgi:CubicO group peptidase (beta-lactamase class C family)